MPDDLVELLNDPTLVGGSGDISTKEILKRLGDRTINGPSRPFQDTGEVYGRNDTSVRTIPKRSEADPNIWQQESSVRPVQDFNGAPYGHGPQPTPPQRWRNAEEEVNTSSPYRQDYESPPPPPPLPPQLSQVGSDGGQRKEWRNSGWGQKNSVGVL